VSFDELMPITAGYCFDELLKDGNPNVEPFGDDVNLFPITLYNLEYSVWLRF
jgi:hypothetical protein